MSNIPLSLGSFLESFSPYIIHSVFYWILYDPYSKPPIGLFPNESNVFESLTADASHLGRLLKQGDGCVVYLYNHKSWKSVQVAKTVQSVSDQFRLFRRLKWFAINCANNRCGDHFKQENLPQIQYYVKVRTKNTKASPVVYRGDLWSISELSTFVHQNHFGPFEVIHSKNELDTIQKEVRSELSTEAALFISPPSKWKTFEDDKTTGFYSFTHDVRTLRKYVKIISISFSYWAKTWLYQSLADREKII